VTSVIEFAEAHGLTVEEAELVLAKRRVPASDSNSRLARARQALTLGERRTGARSVSTQGDEVVEVVPPDTSVEFMKKPSGVTFDPPLRTTDDWEEPP
jgi:hypothetical protein